MGIPSWIMMDATINPFSIAKFDTLKYLAIYRFFGRIIYYSEIPLELKSACWSFQKTSHNFNLKRFWTRFSKYGDIQTGIEADVIKIEAKRSFHSFFNSPSGRICVSSIFFSANACILSLRVIMTRRWREN